MQTAGDRVGDLLAVKAAVLDEDLVGVHPGDDDTGQIDTLALAFERLGIR